MRARLHFYYGDIISRDWADARHYFIRTFLMIITYGIAAHHSNCQRRTACCAVMTPNFHYRPLPDAAGQGDKIRLMLRPSYTMDFLEDFCALMIRCYTLRTWRRQPRRIW